MSVQGRNIAGQLQTPTFGAPLLEGLFRLRSIRLISESGRVNGILFLFETSDSGEVGSFCIWSDVAWNFLSAARHLIKTLIRGATVGPVAMTNWLAPLTRQCKHQGPPTVLY